MAKITVMSRHDAEKNIVYPLKEKTAFISIYNTTQQPVRFYNDPNIVGVCYLMFEDVDATQNSCMEPSQGEEIFKFLDEVGTSIERLIIHCTFGYSRSAAVAAAILEATMNSGNVILNNDDYFPNMHVYTIVLNALIDKNRHLRIRDNLEFEYEDKEKFLNYTVD